MKTAPKLILGLAFLTVLASACGEKAEEPQRWAINSAERISETEIEVKLKFSQPVITISNFVVTESDTEEVVEIESVSPSSTGKTVTVLLKEMSSMKNYNVGAIGWNPYRDEITTNFAEAQWGDSLLNSYYTDLPMGCTVEGGKTIFRLFAPRAVGVKLCMFDTPYTDETGKDLQDGETQIDMEHKDEGYWEVELDGTYYGKYYGYRVSGPSGVTEDYHPEYIVADPYSEALATHQSSPQYHLSIIMDPANDYNFTYQDYMQYSQGELIIMEAHVRDLTMLSDAKNKGTYAGLVEDNAVGGFAHIKDLGINAIELLPIQELDEIEAPYMVTSDDFVFNTWNTYGRNHWGYMTTCFFAPESFYYEGSFEENEWIGVDGGQMNAVKSMVDVFHQNGIAVIMDVVYNHVSQYDRNPFKYIDKKYYFFVNSAGAYTSDSGCGNDFNTGRPMSARLIADSCAYWTEEYMIDGFRYDLATMIEWDTYDLIIPAVEAINPNSYLIAEPWGGGGYDLGGFDEIGMGAWNDKFRNVIRASGNASSGRSSGLAYGSTSTSDLEKCVQGYPGTFDDVENSINYAESHDNNTISDYIRAANKKVEPDDTVVMSEDYLSVATLEEDELAQNKIVAFLLMTAQGAAMIHEGQSFARMKIVIPPEGDSVFPPDSANWELVDGEWMDGDKEWSTKAEPYVMDHDSYEKDNECNWLNWDLKAANVALYDYYKGLIATRKAYNAFTGYPRDDIEFIYGYDAEGGKLKTALAWVYDKELSGDDRSFVCLLNGNKADTATFELPEGDWTVMADKESASVTDGETVSGSVTLDEMEGMILYRM